MHIYIHAPNKDGGERGSQKKKKKCTSANTHGRYFLDECLKGVNPAKIYLPALSFVAWNEDMMARAKAAILDQEVFFAMDAKF